MSKEISLGFSHTDEFGNETVLDKVYDENTDEICTLSWFVDEFKYFLNSLSFPNAMTNNIILLEKGEKVVDKDGEVIYEYK